MSSLDNLDTQGLPGAYALLLLDVTRRWGVEDQDLLATHGLTREQLTSPTVRIPMAVMNAIYEQALVLTEEPALPFYIGMQMKLSSHGFIGFAAMTADTVAQALELVERFISLRIMGFAIRLTRQDERASIHLDTSFNLQPLRDGAVAALMIGLGQMAQVVTGQTLFGVAEIDIPYNPRYESFKHILPAQISFGRPGNVIHFDASYLDLPLVMADSHSMQLAVEQCERELMALGLNNRFIMQVRQLVKKEPQGFHSLEEVSEKLHMSERTLKRQLAHEGTTFSDILEDMRRQAAIEMLERGEDSVERISDSLGYSDVANFSRAFKRWTGASPAQYRRSLGATPGV